MKIKGKDITQLTINHHAVMNRQKRGVFFNKKNIDEDKVSVRTYIPRNRLTDRWLYYHKDITYISKDFLDKDDSMSNFFKKLNEKNININENDSIYFSKASAYPRHRLRNFTQNKRTIKKDRADYIVINNLGFTFSEKVEDFYKDKLTGNIYKLDGGSYNYYKNRPGYYTELYKIINESTPKDATEEDFLFKYAEKELHLDLEKIELYKFIIDDNKSSKEDYFDLFDNYRDKVITERQLDTYINSKDTTLELTDEKYKNLSQMLGSKDQNVVGLGLRMINSFDSTEAIIPLSLLLLFNIHNISRNKEWNTVGMKVLRKKVPFIQSNMVGSVKSQINILNRLTKELAKTAEDREKIRKYGMPMIKGVVDNFISSELSGVDFINKYDIILE